MKKNNYLFRTLLACFLIGIYAALVLPTMAQTYQSKSFLAGFNLQVSSTNGAAYIGTNSFGGTNIYAKGYTVTNSGTYPYVSSYSATLVTNTSAIQDVALWADRDGSPPSANISVQLSGLNASFTNIFQLRFATIPARSASSSYPPGFFQPATSANGLFTFTITGNGTNAVVLSTNLPTAILQGAQGLRLLEISSSNAGTNGTVAGIFLNGYTPN